MFGNIISLIIVVRSININFSIKLPSKAANRSVIANKKETEKRKIDIPRDFIEKIKKLGMNVEDAEILFRTKIDWTAVYSQNKIYCVEPGCDFFTKIDNEELTNHMLTMHKYGDFPCEVEHCDYIAVSQKHLNYHGKMHTMRSDNNFRLKCLKRNCKATFQYQLELERHMRIHNNDVQKCQYCPYSYTFAQNYGDHLNKHFRIKDHKYDHCGLKFTTKKTLVQHSSVHEGIIYFCLICNKYETGRKNTMQIHLRMKHSDLLGKNINWDAVEKYVKLK